VTIATLSPWSQKAIATFAIIATIANLSPWCAVGIARSHTARPLREAREAVATHEACHCHKSDFTRHISTILIIAPKLVTMVARVHLAMLTLAEFASRRVLT
jgi:hypothetical protein